MAISVVDRGELVNVISEIAVDVNREPQRKIPWTG